MTITILGIRHHGVGSAKHVLQRLQEIQPDMIMIEGPPEITDVLKYIGHEGLVPPVSIMVYDQSEPKTSVFYPFSSFSPEWVAADYANKNGIALRALDMPAAVNLQMKADVQERVLGLPTIPTGLSRRLSLRHMCELENGITQSCQRQGRRGLLHVDGH